ncbi:MAG TPA: hypothetical protein VJ673_08210 [Aromatoleum sp.]|uniref:hypothetical protein n=1 Tax=Aromatoleum sp. TaxID=2307007 RepID=UPI002B45C6B7|nr:hypothetical protein [Aromatoleum sp.]HJV25656.1 hypothetical protein [Aromatoleum sp.]
MTRFAEPEVIACPRCESLLLRQRLASFNNFGSVYWSDGFASFLGVSPVAALGCCGICEGLFWFDDVARLGVMPREPISLRWPGWKRCLAGLMSNRLIDSEAAWKAVPDAWHSAPYVESPRGRELWWALERGLASTQEREIYVRTRLWWAGNHPRRGSRAEQPMSDEQVGQNMAALLVLLRAQPDEKRDAVVEGELLRELGRFDQAITVLQDSAARGSDRAAIIVERAREGKTDVCVVERNDFSF